MSLDSSAECGGECPWEIDAMGRGETKEEAETNLRAAAEGGGGEDCKVMDCIISECDEKDTIWRILNRPWWWPND